MEKEVKVFQKITTFEKKGKKWKLKEVRDWHEIDGFTYFRIVENGSGDWRKKEGRTNFKIGVWVYEKITTITGKYKFVRDFEFEKIED